MARILCLAPSGFGKSTGIGTVPELDIKGLSPEDTYVISVTSKPLPFRGSNKQFPVTTVNELTKGRRVITNKPDEIEKVLLMLAMPESPIKNVILDDFNYIMQDYYMDNALKTGWDTPKKIGFDMNKIFKAMEKFENKNVIILAHGEDVLKPDGRIYTKMKTTGKMVDEYVTPEGKFDVVLVGRSRFDSSNKKVVKEYITNEDDTYSSPKSPVGMFDKLVISNDLGIIIESVNKYYE